MLRALLLLTTWLAVAALPRAHATTSTTTNTNADIARIPLITTDHYDPAREQGRGFSVFTSSLGLATLGSFVLANMDLEADLRTRLEAPELKAYFPRAAERQALVRRIANGVKKKHLDPTQSGITNDRVNGAIRYAATDLVGVVIRRVLETEGVKDAGRREQWARRLLQPFQRCMKAVHTYNEGQRCLTALQADVVKNLGLAISHELIRQEMGEAQLAGRAQEYRKCLRTREPGADARVKACVTQAVRTAALGFGQQKVREAVSEQAPGAEGKVTKAITPEFRRCLGQAKDRNGFGRCATELTARAGGLVAAEIILQNEQVRSSVPTSAKRKALAEAGRAAFARCAAEISGTEKSDKLVDICGQRVKLDTTRAVALEILQKNAAQSLPAGAPQTNARAAVAKGLAACWNSDSPERSNSCLRQNIESLVGRVADARLAQELPAGLVKEKPALRSSLVNEAGTCIRGRLPADVLNATDTAERVEDCAAALLKKAALEVAGFQLRDLLKGKTNQGDQVVAKIVGEGFASCLGERPDAKRLEKCSLELRILAGGAVARLLFKQEVEKFFENGGGLEPYGWTEQRRDSFLDRVLSRHVDCLDVNVKPGPQAKQDRAVDDCFKSSVRKLATELAGVEFRRRMGDQMPEAADLDSVSTSFLTDFGTCLDEKRSPDFNVNQLVDHIETCRLRLTKQYTLRVGREQLARAVEDTLPAPALAARRAELSVQLGGKFAACLEKVTDEDGAGRNGCTDQLKEDATRALVIEATRVEARTLLGATEVPAELLTLEKTFERCMQTVRSADACGVQHAKDAAQTLGSIKLRQAVASMLGREAYQKQEKRVGTLEADYYACVAKLTQRQLTAEFLAGLKACGKELEARGLQFAQTELDQRMRRPAGKVSEEEARIRAQTALAIPCLDAIVPAQPYEADALKRIDPEGSLNVVANLIGAYIDYDVQRADADLATVITEIAHDLQAAGPEEARRRLLRLLRERGMLDQLLRAMVRDQVRRTLDALPAAERLPPEVVRRLLDQGVLDRALTPEVMKRLTPILADRVLEPLLVEGKNMNDPALKATIAGLEREVTNTLVDSHEFGDFLLASAVQQKVTAQSNGFTRWAGRTFAGYKSFNWNRVRITPAGREADEFIRENILRPRLLGETVAPAEQARREAEAERLVTRALKSP